MGLVKRRFTLGFVLISWRGLVSSYVRRGIVVAPHPQLSQGFLTTNRTRGAFLFPLLPNGHYCRGGGA